MIGEDAADLQPRRTLAILEPVATALRTDGSFFGSVPDFGTSRAHGNGLRSSWIWHAGPAASLPGEPAPRLTCTFVVVGTGVDPVTSRFSVGRRRFRWIRSMPALPQMSWSEQENGTGRHRATLSGRRRTRDTRGIVAGWRPKGRSWALPRSVVSACQALWCRALSAAVAHLLAARSTRNNDARMHVKASCRPRSARGGHDRGESLGRGQARSRSRPEGPRWLRCCAARSAGHSLHNPSRA